MKLLTRWLLIGSLAVLAVHAIAADAPVTSENQSETVEPQSAESTNAPIDDKPAEEIFVPSEDISEDFAVSFPVDI
ncbi:MAG: hypothetical protein VB948_12080 [Pseudomonadales bacterium]|jgi:hypothetical protein